MDDSGDFGARRTIVAVFDTAEEAETGLDALRSLGVQPEDVSVMIRDRDAAEELAEENGVNVTGGAATGAISGGLLGGVAGWLVGIGALAIPGIGPVLGAGALAGLLTGAAIGAAAGGLLGALVGLGVPEAEAHTYQSYVREGRVLVTAHANDEAGARGIRDALEAANAYDVRTYDTPTAAAAADDYLDTAADTMDEGYPNAALDLDNVVEDIDGGTPDPDAPIGGLIGAALAPSAADAPHDLGQMVQELRDTPYRDATLTPETQAALNSPAIATPADVAMFAQPAQADAAATAPATLPPEDVTGRDQLAATPNAPVDFSAFMPTNGDQTPVAPTTPDTDYRSGGDAARNATPEQLAALSGGASFAIQEAQPTRGAFTPNTTETEYRSGGDATRGGTE